MAEINVSVQFPQRILDWGRDFMRTFSVFIVEIVETNKMMWILRDYIYFQSVDTVRRYFTSNYIDHCCASKRVILSDGNSADSENVLENSHLFYRMNGLTLMHKACSMYGEMENQQVSPRKRLSQWKKANSKKNWNVLLEKSRLVYIFFIYSIFSSNAWFRSLY